MKIVGFNALYNIAVNNYTKYKGSNAYAKLYDKISKSRALSDLCGQSILRRFAPTEADFTYYATLMPSIYITFDNTVSAMAALIMLKIWNEQVNKTYGLCSDLQVFCMANSIIQSSIYLRQIH